MNIEEKELVALTGPNGAGKSTLVKTITGLTDIFLGSIFFNNEDITSAETENIARKGIALMPQEESIFPSLSVYKNLKASCFHEDKFDELLNQVYELFPKLEEINNRIARSLSGGEAKMLGLGSVIMTAADFFYELFGR